MAVFFNYLDVILSSIYLFVYVLRVYSPSQRLFRVSSIIIVQIFRGVERWGHSRSSRTDIRLVVSNVSLQDIASLSVTSVPVTFWPHRKLNTTVGRTYGQYSFPNWPEVTQLVRIMYNRRSTEALDKEDDDWRVRPRDRHCLQNHHVVIFCDRLKDHSCFLSMPSRSSILFCFQVYADEPALPTLSLLAWQKSWIDSKVDQMQFRSNWYIWCVIFSFPMFFRFDVTYISIRPYVHHLQYICSILQLHMWGYPVLLFFLLELSSSIFSLKSASSPPSPPAKQF